MYKILLVEDELLTRVGIRAFYPWEEDGFTVCGEAASGIATSAAWCLAAWRKRKRFGR